MRAGLSGVHLFRSCPDRYDPPVCQPSPPSPLAAASFIPSQDSIWSVLLPSTHGCVAALKIPICCPWLCASGANGRLCCRKCRQLLGLCFLVSVLEVREPHLMFALGNSDIYHQCWNNCLTIIITDTDGNETTWDHFSDVFVHAQYDRFFLNLSN